MNKTSHNIYGKKHMDKNAIRIEVKDRIENMPHVEKERESIEVSRMLISLLAEKEFHTLVSYDPMDDEVDVQTANQWAKDQGKKVIIFDQKLKEVPSIKGDNALCLVPGRAFT